jgi:hypothetical protein
MPFPVNNNNRDHAKKDGSVCAELGFWFIGGYKDGIAVNPSSANLKLRG